MPTIRTAPVTATRWNDVVTVFGRRGDDPGWCWCRRFFDQPGEGGECNNRAALREEIAMATVPPGIVAYLDRIPVGWTRVMPRASVPAIGANRALRRILPDNPGAWWITCFAVDRRHRTQGVATALIEAAVDHARSHGATAVEGHPVDTDALQAQRVSGSALFTGTMHLFLAAGFREIGRTYASRPVMRRELRS
jgi:GNAT superfamily N-acetyltransferase